MKVLSKDNTVIDLVQIDENMAYVKDGVLTLSPTGSIGVFGNNINYFMDYIY